ncbi:MAG: cysteine desulfurase-like protein [Chthoniobacterales bacterium]
MATTNSVEAIRAQFPALQRVENGNAVAYFDGPGGTQVPQSVADAMADYLLHHNANTHWAFPTSRETDAIILGAREAVADLLNASPDEIAFGANMTTLTFHLARAIGRGLKSGDEIVITELDHHANVAPWRALEKERGITIRVARMIPETGQLDWAHFGEQLNGRTKLVTIGAASNALGTITDVRRAGEMAHNVGAQIFVDAVHYAPHELVDVRTLGCDFLACSSYKFYGPHLGILFGQHDLLAALDFPKLIPAPDSAPERAETGTQNHEGIAGAAAAVEFLASFGSGNTRRERLRSSFSELHRRGDELFAQMWNGLREIDGVATFGPPPGQPRTPTIAFTVPRASALEVSRKLADRGVFASDGHFYAMTVIERLGQSQHGVVRAGCACYTTKEEVDRLIEGVRSIADRD